MRTLRKFLCLASISFANMIDCITNTYYDIYYLIYDSWYYGTLRTVRDACGIALIIFLIYFWGFVL